MNPVELNNNRTNNDQQTFVQTTNGSIRYIRASGQQILWPYWGQPPQGLADLFVAKHTNDETLRQQLLSKNGFVTPNHESPRNDQLNNQTEVGRWAHGHYKACNQAL